MDFMLRMFLSYICVFGSYTQFLFLTAAFLSFSGFHSIPNDPHTLFLVCFVKFWFFCAAAVMANIKLLITVGCWVRHTNNIMNMGQYLVPHMSITYDNISALVWKYINFTDEIFTVYIDIDMDYTILEPYGFPVCLNDFLGINIYGTQSSPCRWSKTKWQLSSAAEVSFYPVGVCPN